MVFRRVVLTIGVHAFSGIWDTDFVTYAPTSTTPTEQGGVHAFSGFWDTHFVTYAPTSTTPTEQGGWLVVGWLVCGCVGLLVCWWAGGS